MTTSIMEQYRLVRGLTLGFEKILNESIVDVIPEGYNNNVRWNIGHLLVTPYIALYGEQEVLERIPKHYISLFARGTNPRDWQGEVPTLADLFERLRAQMEQIEQDFSDRVYEPLPKVFSIGGKDIRTYGELLIFMIYHEGWHTGYILSLLHAVKK